MSIPGLGEGGFGVFSPGTGVVFLKILSLLPVMLVGWLAAPRDAEFQTTVEWHPSQVVGYREATWLGAVLYSAWWQVAQVPRGPVPSISSLVARMS